MSRCHSPGGLSRHFERVCVITLDRRPERRARLEAHLQERGLAGGIHWVPAVDGLSAATPEGWGAGPGAWGCRLSHLAVLQQALEDQVEQVLVLEDDVLFSPFTAASLPKLLADLPENWGQFYLGGQHLKDPVACVTPLIWRAVNINRTHAYAVHRRALPAVIGHLERLEDYLRRGQWHVDHQLGDGQSSRLWETCAPSWWLAGQAEGHSDIAGDTPEERWWHHSRYAFQMPLVTAYRDAISPEWNRVLLFDPDPARTAGALVSRFDFLKWCLALACEALVRGKLPACTPQMAQCWAGCWHAGMRSLEELPSQPRDYPFNGLFSHPLNEQIPLKP